MIDHLTVLRRESERFAACGRRGDLGAAVPSCPDWTLADLIWHLTEVQHFWGSIVADLLTDPAGVPPLDRPPDGDLVQLFGERSRRLRDALATRPADAECWSWHADGHSVGWVRRRQAHEALIHRVDAELAIEDRTGVDEQVAADGIAELVAYFLDDDIPEWGSFTPDGSTVTVAVDGGDSYGFAFGRFTGTGPESGTEWDFETVVPSAPGGPTVSGSAAALDVWLWGRGREGVRADDPDAMARLREAVARATQ